MPQFAYKAKDTKGALVEGTIDAAARGAVVTRLQQMGYFPVAISEGGAKPAAKGGAAAKAAARPAAASEQRAEAARATAAVRVKSAQLTSFNRQLADLIASGVPLVRGLGILARQHDDEAMKGVVEQLLSDVQGGDSFAEALAKHPGVFSKLYVAMVRSGEAGGMLAEVLERLADFSESEELLRGKVMSALAYPMVMVVAGGAAIFIMFTFVIPRIVETFEQMEQALPGITLFLIDVSAFMQEYGLVLAAVLAAAGAGAWRGMKTPAGKALWDRFVLRIPVLGEVVRKREAAQFARTFGSLLANGVSILQALDIVKEVAGNTVFKAEIEGIAGEITQGSSVAEPLRRSVVFPTVAANMIAVGEETGQLPHVLRRISESYEKDTERLLRTLTSLLEPLIIVTMGVIVAFVVIAMLLPIFTLDPSGGLQ
ncbi:MAG: type II secretion system F family protein [Candidatus Sumerlaeia bacterium]|nr:type II secretion system F family protein [Candidatus Sumerlaeia bacterium]